MSLCRPLPGDQPREDNRQSWFDLFVRFLRSVTSRLMRVQRRGKKCQLFSLGRKLLPRSCFAHERRVICILLYGVPKLDGHLGLILTLAGRLHRHNVFWSLRSDLPPEFSHGRRNNGIVIGADDRYGVAHFFGQVMRVSKDSGPMRAVRMA
jgi:hypothetical protein